MKNEKLVTFACFAESHLIEKVWFVRHVTANAQHMDESFYKKLQAVGVCPRCGKNLLYGDEKSCVECRAKSAESMSKIRANDVEKYNERQKAWRKARYEKDKENCKYFSTEEKAEAKLKELRGGE